MSESKIPDADLSAVPYNIMAVSEIYSVVYSELLEKGRVLQRDLASKAVEETSTLAGRTIRDVVMKELRDTLVEQDIIKAESRKEERGNEAYIYWMLPEAEQDE